MAAFFRFKVMLTLWVVAEAVASSRVNGRPVSPFASLTNLLHHLAREINKRRERHGNNRIIQFLKKLLSAHSYFDCLIHG